MKYIYIFIGIIVLKFIINLVNYINGFRLERIWFSFFAKKNVNAITYTKQIQNHFKNAGLKSNYQPCSIPVGYGQIANTTISTFDNIFSNSQSTSLFVETYFLEARGVYRKRMLDSFNPLYWMDCIINLPKHLIEYLGLDTETIFTKLFQIIYWLIDSVLLVYYHEPIFNFIKDFISKLFK